MKKITIPLCLKHRYTVAGWLLVLTMLSRTAFAETITVGSISALQTAINSASPGDIIIMTNGTYTTSAAITVTRQGTASQPITIAAQTIGGVEIRGTSGFQLNSPASYIIIRGFRFTHNTGTARIATGATRNLITRNVFECAPAGTGNKPYFSVSGDDNEISYNTFQNKDTEGCMITIQGPGSSGMAQRTWIHHNYFYNFEPSGANNSSSIQPGLSSRSLTSAHSLIEYNLFVQCRGENENIANKSSDNIYRYNTFGAGTTELSLRHGNRMQVYGNFFLGSQGLRFCADDHRIYSNYFEGCSFAINCVNGDGEVADGDPLTSHDRPDRVQIVHNTLVNNQTNYAMPGRSGGLGATSITFTNNVIQGGSAISLNGSYPGPTWSGNILWNTSGGAMPASGYTTVNPQLIEDASSVYHIQSGSPAINASTGSYTYVTLDFDGQARSGTRDAGGDEYQTTPVTNRPLTTADVGPNAGTTPAPGNVALNKPVTASSSDTNIPSNAVDGNTTTRWSASPFPQWLEVDLGALYDINKTEVVCYADRAYQFVVESKTTSGGAYTQIVNRSTNTTPGTVAAPITNTFPAVEARYVRITVSGASGYMGLWSSILEFRVFGAASLAMIEDAEASSVQKADVKLSLSQETLRYAVEKEGHVKIVLYNTVENRTSVLRDEYLPVGEHHSPIDATLLPPGLHVIKVTLNGETSTYKIFKKS